jgi:hypothetical protein
MRKDDDDDDDGTCFNRCGQYVEWRKLSWFWIEENAGAYLTKRVQKSMSQNSKKYIKKTRKYLHNLTIWSLSLLLLLPSDVQCVNGVFWYYLTSKELKYNACSNLVPQSDEMTKKMLFKTTNCCHKI